MIGRETGPQCFTMEIFASFQKGVQCLHRFENGSGIFLINRLELLVGRVDVLAMEALEGAACLGILIDQLGQIIRRIINLYLTGN
ncbi:hypothetical protein NJB93_19490 [Brucella intermedia]|uniref:hypothetical protein n=1 Tax=Brucella intermedia TaxID=94625 RepID=UPI00209AB9BD|nr:hypothetical protein [Brucella intermedia]MCO7728766.1 hypothetical protein [Brucella intermedia]